MTQPTRSRIFEADLYVNDRTGNNTQKNERFLRKVHADKLTEMGKKRDLPDYYEDDEEPEAFTPDVILCGTYICESYDNPAVYCAYDEDDHQEGCLYCYHPRERK